MRAQRRGEALDRDDGRPRTADELMEALQFRSNSLVLANVRRNTWALDAGLRPGDRIIRVDDRRAQSAGDLGRLLDETSGGLVRIRVIRDGQEEVLTASLADEYLGPDRRLPYDRQYSDDDLFDSSAASSPGRPALRERPRRLERPRLGITMRTDRGGVRVTSVADGSPADEAGLRQQDRIAAINGEPIDRSEDVAWMVANSRPGARLEIEVTREGRDRFLVASLDGWGQTARRQGDNLTR
jgi:S1-C subfamily serine protease